MGAQPASAAAPHGSRLGASTAQRERCCDWFCGLLIGTILITGIALLIALFVHTADPVYSVAVAGVAGLDPARDLSATDRPTLSPVLNLTFHIDNVKNAWGDPACVSSLSTATVSYGNALLAKGSVPEFCACRGRESEQVATVWGQDVVVPRFLRDQLAGELAVGDAAADVLVRWRGTCLVCKAKVGGGLSRCEKNC